MTSSCLPLPEPFRVKRNDATPFLRRTHSRLPRTANTTNTIVTCSRTSIAASLDSIDSRRYLVLYGHQVGECDSYPAREHGQGIAGGKVGSQHGAFLESEYAFQVYCNTSQL